MRYPGNGGVLNIHRYMYYIIYTVSQEPDKVQRSDEWGENFGMMVWENTILMTEFV
jgi:hypothetical protein